MLNVGLQDDGALDPQNGNYYSILGYIGVMERKMETTIVYTGLLYNMSPSACSKLHKSRVHMCSGLCSNVGNAPILLKTNELKLARELCAAGYTGPLDIFSFPLLPLKLLQSAASGVNAWEAQMLRLRGESVR